MIDFDNSYLIGSWALKAHGLLTDREPGDIDIISLLPKSNLILNNHLVEISSANDPVETTNKEIYNYCKEYCLMSIQTPVGILKVAPIEILKVLKLSSIPVQKAKHYWDLQKLDTVDLESYLKQLAERRLKQTYKRIEKNIFFNRYQIIRFIDHDELHSYVAKVPAYTKMINKSVEICEHKFQSLTFEEKYLELFEENFVLAMERELILNYKQAPILLKTFLKEFSNTVDTNGPAMKWLSRLTIPGKLKDRPDWLAQWGQDNYHNYISRYSPWWKKTLTELNEDFWVRFLNIRDLEPLKQETHKDIL